MGEDRASEKEGTDSQNTDCSIGRLDHIIAPCQRCTQSVAKHQRSANGHRWVFHVGEIKARERTFFPGEKGVISPPPQLRTSRSNTPLTSQIPSAPIRGVDPSTVDARSRSEDVAMEDSEGKDWASADLPGSPIAAGFRRVQNPSTSSSRESSSIGSRSPVNQSRMVAGSRPLEEGNTVYWHHLVSAGERCQPLDPDSLPKKATITVGR